MVHPALVLFAIAGPSAAPQSLAETLPGIYANEEAVYFAGESGDPAPPWTSLEVERLENGVRLQPVDAFGARRGSAWRLALPGGNRIVVDGCTGSYRREGDGWRLAGSEGECAGKPRIESLSPSGLRWSPGPGEPLTLRRARRFDCWIAVRKPGPGEDGGEDWHFERGLALHDQGGRARSGGGDTGAPETIIRLRNVVWPPPSRNRPSLVL